MPEVGWSGLVTILVFLAVLYGLVRFVKWSWRRGG